MTTAARKLQPDPDSRDDLDVKRDAIITIRLSAEERENWQAAADAGQRKLADWIRITVNAMLAKDAQLEHMARGVDYVQKHGPIGLKPARSKKGGK